IDTLLYNSQGYNASYIYIDDVSLILTPCTGIEEQNLNSNIKIYPNPLSDILNIKAWGFSEIILYDVAARKLLQQKFTNSTTVNTEQLAKGLYLYEVRNKNGLCKKGKVVKE
ncbi:MAG TPA: T9SS type A sorting domain-containing protein, partial [Bacteroidia bacterium]|nr:T9SS type A sorting domain-containing protein [Bacteroidia bacterium]